jgi:spore coat polysaccharide biosynthesis predicted glycosyltransferase SpsG
MSDPGSRTGKNHVMRDLWTSLTSLKTNFIYVFHNITNNDDILYVLLSLFADKH